MPCGFGFALDANRPVLLQATSGLFWVTIMFVSTLAVQRSTWIETTDGARRALLLAGIEPPAVFVGKSIAVAVQLLVVAKCCLNGEEYGLQVAVVGVPGGDRCMHTHIHSC